MELEDSAEIKFSLIYVVIKLNSFVFGRYRGLKSFRTSPWDPKENLPSEYARYIHLQVTVVIANPGSSR